jgi:hypothetical protein
MSERLQVGPGWTAWLKHHRGTKTEARMLSCLASKTPFYVPSKFPPETPRADRVRPTAAPQPTVFADRPGASDGKIDEIANRQLARERRTDGEREIETRRVKKQRRADRALEEALSAARQNRAPNVEGADDLDVILVSDPLEEAEMERVGRGPPMVRRKKNVSLQRRVVSIRDDAVGRMAKRGQLGEGTEREIRLKAARYYEDVYARAEIGGARAIDFTRDVVDSSYVHVPDADNRLTAQKRLGDINKTLGNIGAEVVYAVLILKWSSEILAQSHGDGNERGRLHWGWRFKECLDTIAKLAGLTPRPNRPQAHRDHHAAAADLASNPALHAAVQRAKPAPDVQLLPRQRTPAAAD